MTRETHDWDALIEADRVHRSIYTDPDIFALEMQRIFESTWIYVGHTSQVSLPGDFVTARVGRQPVIVTRHRDGEVHVLYNRCAHKGAQVVSERCGRVKAFRCSYHGWGYDTDGRLIAVPAEQGYEGTRFCRQNAEARLQGVARVGIYRGFIFASLVAEGPDLETWLKGVDSSIDNLVDRSAQGELEIVGGVLRYEVQANWKFHVENLNDTLHPMVTHQSSSQTARSVAARHVAPDSPLPAVVQIISPFTNKYSFFDAMGITVFEHGHSYTGGRISIHSAYSDIPEYYAQLEAAYGPERTREILSINRHNTVIYPSLTLKGAIQTIRVVTPLAVDRTLIESWTFRLKGAPQELLRRSVLYCTLINSSGGLVQPDDHEAYIRMQRGLNCTASGNDWVSMHRYFGKETPTENAGLSALGTSDLACRNQYRTWKQLMSAADAAS